MLWVEHDVWFGPVRRYSTVHVYIMRYGRLRAVYLILYMSYFILYGRLRAALVEHEVCVLAGGAFYGSAWSTWANLIGARRWARGKEARVAYIDADTMEPTPTCAQERSTVPRAADAMPRAVGHALRNGPTGAATVECDVRQVNAHVH